MTLEDFNNIVDNYGLHKRKKILVDKKLKEINRDFT